MVSLISKSFAKIATVDTNIEVYEVPDSSAGSTIKELIVSNTGTGTVNFDVSIQKKDKDIITIIPTTTLQSLECNVIDLNTFLSVGDKMFVKVDTANVIDVLVSIIEP